MGNCWNARPSAKVGKGNQKRVYGKGGQFRQRGERVTDGGMAERTGCATQSALLLHGPSGPADTALRALSPTCYNRLEETTLTGSTVCAFLEQKIGES